MDIRDLRDAVEHLGRFADVRESAKEPRDRIFVRAREGALTFAAGDESKAVYVTGHQDEGDGKALVSARLLLTAGKALRGKGQVRFLFDGKGGATMATSAGGRVVLPRVGTDIPDWPRPRRLDMPDAEASVPSDFWPTLAKYTEVPTDLNIGLAKAVAMRMDRDQMRLTWAHDYVYVTTSLYAPVSISQGEIGGLPVEFVQSLRGLDSESTLSTFVNGPAQVKCGSVMAVTTTPWVKPGTFTLNAPDYTTQLTMERKALVTAVKALPNPDEYKRLTLTVESDRLLVSPYGGPGSVSVDASVRGVQPAQLHVVGTLLGKLLAALPGDALTLGFDADNDAPVAMTEGTTWRVFLAPVRR